MVITPFNPWKSEFCTCPRKYSLSPYTGCGHLCLYCYASSYIRNFYSPRSKKDFLIRLDKEIKKIPADSFISMANSSDPYQPLEKKLNLTRAALEILKDYNLKIMIVTKSALILKDLDILKKCKKVIACITLTTLKDDLSKKLEKKASAPTERLNAIKQLSKHIPVICRVDPLIYPLNTAEIVKIIKEVKNNGAQQIITSTYKAKPDNFKRMINRFPEYKKIWDKLYLAKGERLVQYIYLPAVFRKKIIKEVKNTCLKENLAFSACREGWADLNTDACDGSSFFQKE